MSFNFNNNIVEVLRDWHPLFVSYYDDIEFDNLDYELINNLTQIFTINMEVEVDRIIRKEMRENE